MDLTPLIEQEREHYVEQFERFVDRQDAACVRGHAEVKLQVPEPTSLYRQLVCVDFVRNDHGAEAIWFEPERLLRFEGFSETLGAMRINVETLRWDNVVFHYNLPPVLSVKGWFERWFDPDDVRHDPNSKLGLTIHSLAIEPLAISVDFGTAPPEALLSLLGEMERSGVDLITINDRSDPLRQ